MSEIPPAVFVSDLKQEIVPVLEKAWKEFNVDVSLWAPTGSPSSIFPHTDFNFLEAPIDCYWNDNYPTENAGAFFRSQLDITNPVPAPDAMNVFFSGNGRRTAFGIGGELIIRDPGIASHSEILKITSDPPRAKAFMREAAMRKDSETDFFSNEVSRECRSVLSACEGRNEHHFGDFLSYVSNPLAAFGESGHLGQSGKHTVARISDIRKGSKPKVLVCCVPLSHLNDMRIPMSLFANAVFTAIKMLPQGRAVHAILDEFTALALPNYHKDVIVLRGLGCTSEVYIQSWNAVADVMSEKAAAVIEDQSDIITYSALSDQKVANQLSSAIGSTTIKGFDANVADRFDDIRFGVRDVDIPVITPQTLTAMPPDMQIIKIRGMRPILAKKLAFWDIAGLREYMSENPLEGAMPETKAKAKIKINKDGTVDVISPKVPKHFSDKKNKPKSLLWAINPASFVWLFVWLAIYFGGNTMFPQFLWPALRTNYTYSGSYSAPQFHACRYYSLNGSSFVHAGGNCPIIMWTGGRQS